jgi:hypothetical protein
MPVIGTPEELAATAAQLEAIYKHTPDVVLAGSMGRAAMYDSFGYAGAEPLPIRSDNQPLTSYRDLDMLFVPEGLYGGVATAHLWHPHIIDTGLGRYIQRAKDGGCMLYAEVEEGVRAPIPADPALIKPVTRTFLGVSVLTLSVGTQQQVERLVPRTFDQDKRRKYDASRATFAAFADSIRETHPEEFLPEELYAPFGRVEALRASYL